MPCGVPQTGFSGTVLNAVFVQMLPGTKVDTSSSTGDFIRLQVRRASVVIWNAATQVNTGVNLITILVALQNGDEVCVQVCNDPGFIGTVDEDCRIVPTPAFSLVPDFATPANFLQVSFESTPGNDTFLAPNSGAGHLLTFLLTFTDAAGITGTVTLTGSKAALQSIDDANPIVIVPTTGTATIVTGFGNINVVRAFNVGYALADNVTIESQLTDHLNIDSATDHVGGTAVIMASATEYTLDGTAPLTYLTIPIPFDDMTVTGKLLKTPYRIAFTATAGQRLFNILSANIGNETDLNQANRIKMSADGVLAPTTSHSISGLLQITSDDPNLGAGNGWTVGTLIEFDIWYFTH